MAKQNVRIETLLVWDRYKDKPFAEALPMIYLHAQEISKKRCAWYWESIKSKRRSSICTRVFIFIFLIIGTLFPILAGLGNESVVRLQFTQYGVAALAFAGLLQVVDRVFGWSSGWLRYIKTVTAMENCTRRFELDWASYIIDKKGKIDENDTKRLFDLAKQFEDDLSKLQSDETDQWITEFSNSVTLISELIKSQRESVQKTTAAAHAAIASSQQTVQESNKVQENGAIELKIIHEFVPTTVSIAIDQEPAQPFIGSSWVRVDLKPGPHILSIVTTGETSKTIQKIVEVTPGGLTKTEVKLSEYLRP